MRRPLNIMRIVSRNQQVESQLGGLTKDGSSDAYKNSKKVALGMGVLISIVLVYVSFKEDWDLWVFKRNPTTYQRSQQIELQEVRQTLHSYVNQLSGKIESI